MFVAYLAMIEHSPGCTDCHYNGTGNKCSLIASKLVTAPTEGFTMAPKYTRPSVAQSSRGQVSKGKKSLKFWLADTQP